MNVSQTCIFSCLHSCSFFGDQQLSYVFIDAKYVKCYDKMLTMQRSECTFNKFKVFGGHLWSGLRNSEREEGGLPQILASIDISFTA